MALTTLNTHPAARCENANRVLQYIEEVQFNLVDSQTYYYRAHSLTRQTYCSLTWTPRFAICAEALEYEEQLLTFVFQLVSAPCRPGSTRCTSTTTGPARTRTCTATSPSRAAHGSLASARIPSAEPGPKARVGSSRRRFPHGPLCTLSVRG